MADWAGGMYEGAGVKTEGEGERAILVPGVQRDSVSLMTRPAVQVRERKTATQQQWHSISNILCKSGGAGTGSAADRLCQCRRDPLTKRQGLCSHARVARRSRWALRAPATPAYSGKTLPPRRPAQTWTAPGQGSAASAARVIGRYSTVSVVCTQYTLYSWPPVAVINQPVLQIQARAARSPACVSQEDEHCVLRLHPIWELTQVRGWPNFPRRTRDASSLPRIPLYCVMRRLGSS